MRMITTPPLAPAISVAIPMYNTEKYIGALLESLLAQTFQDFEVIVVDDCSTDNSCAVVENYIPKFGGRLTLSRMQKNSGGPGAPSNKGVALSRGKYVYFMDNDDLLVNNALEILYNYAEKFNADVVYTDRGFRFNKDADKPFPAQENLELHGWQGSGPFFNEPVLDPEDTAGRIEKFLKNQVGWTPWEKLVRRDLLIENDITFPNTRSSGDIVWTIQILTYAKKFLRIPDPLYIYRANSGSITRKKRSAQENIEFWINININGLRFLDDWMSRQKFYQENPQYKWNVLEMFEKIHLNIIRQSSLETSPPKFYSIVNSCFSDKFHEYGALIAYLCTSSNLSNLRLRLTLQRVEELENKLKQLQGG